MRSAIGGNMSLFCLGFGDDVDYSFLDVMGKENKGLARRIYEASDAAVQLQVEELDYEYNSEPIVLCNFEFKLEWLSPWIPHDRNDHLDTVLKVLTI